MDTNKAVAESLSDEFGKLLYAPLLAGMLDVGLLGGKSGCRSYRYEGSRA